MGNFLIKLKKIIVGDIFGVLKRKSRKSTQKILDEIDEKFWPEE